jgi:acetylornithine deacetylase/succinyl-diaminopimelate desuccinylase-like protein
MKVFYFSVFMLCSTFVSGQSINKAKIQKLADKYWQETLAQYNEFLHIPNVGHFPEQAEANLNWCNAVFQELDFSTHVLQTKHLPLLFAQNEQRKDRKTILFYLQIDGQPVDSSKWDQGNPFIPVLKERTTEGEWKALDWNRLKKEYNPEWRVFARSSADSKGPALCFISALQILKAEQIDIPFNVKVIMDFQEEMGSPGTPGAVHEYQDLLQADMLVIMDGTRHISNLPTLTYGARGIAKVSMTVFGPRAPLHSGQYGNYAPNPAFRLAKLLGDLKDDSGKVTLPGFYDGIELSEEEKAILNSVPEDHEALNKRLGIAKAEAVGGSYQEALQYPSLNIRGMQSAWIGKEVRTIIPAEATAEIDMRLVPESDPDRLFSLLKDYVLAEGYHLVENAPTDEERAKYDKLIALKYSLSYHAFQTPYDSDIGRWLEKAMIRAFDAPPVKMRTTGGSQPMGPFIKTLGVPAVSVRIPNPDNNIHSPNENLRLGNFMEGLRSCISVLTEQP